MKKVLPLFLLLIVISILSCSKDDSPKNKWKVSRVVGKFVNDPIDSVFSAFDYSVQNEIKIYSSTTSGISGSIIYHFDDQNRILSIHYSYSSNIPGYNIDFAYFAQKVRMISTRLNDAQASVVDSTIFYIGDNGLATRSVYYTLLNNNTIDSASASYTWNDHDLVSTRTINKIPVVESKLFYDNSYNPFYITDLPITLSLNFSGSLFYACNKHNCITIKSSDGIYTLKTESRQYNSDNYLSHIIAERLWTQGKFESKIELIPQ